MVSSTTLTQILLARAESASDGSLSSFKVFGVPLNSLIVSGSIPSIRGLQIKDSETILTILDAFPNVYLITISSTSTDAQV